MGVREKCMPNLDSAGSLYLKFDYALKTNKKKNITLLISLLRYRALSDVFLSGGEVVKGNLW